MQKIKDLVKKLNFYRMMRYSRKGLCSWEELHWDEKIKKVKDLISQIKKT